MFTQFGILDFGTPELVLILAIVLVLFGSKKLPELSRSIGESVRELKNATKSADELHKEVKGQVNEVKASFNTPTQVQVSSPSIES
jgi:sec-independent protein translocase protein TatA